MHSQHLTWPVLLLVGILTGGCGPPSGSAINLPAPVAVPSVAVPSASTTRMCISVNNLPDLRCTPGVADPSLTQDNMHQTFCIAGWMDKNRPRPPVSFTNQLKIQQMAAYGFVDPPSAHEEDHLIAREIGGLSDSMNGLDVRNNLWPEPGASPNAKDKVEGLAHAAVCAIPPRLQLAEAQQAMAQDWPALGRRLGLIIP